MGAADLKKELEQALAELAPSATITDVDFEAANVVVYTKHPELFAEDPNLVRQLAKKLRKRIVIRADPGVLADPNEAEDIIHQVVPQDAGITRIEFLPESCEVIIESNKVGLVIGRGGSTLNELRKRIGWDPRALRTPPIHSKTLDDIRHFLKSKSEERVDFLRKVGRRIYRGTRSNEEPWVRMTSLGGYREVGRSCHLIQTNESKVLVDVGMNPGGQGRDLTPYLHVAEVYPYDQIDAIVLTHAHLDHSALIPLLFKLGYDGPVYCTGPTRDLTALLQLDFLKVQTAEGGTPPYESKHVQQQVLNTIMVDYGDTTDITPDLRLTFKNAGHILGSASAHFHVGDGNHNILVTGDIKYEKSWLYNAAVNRFPRVESVIMEATYGSKKDRTPSRKQAAHELAEVAKRTIDRGGKLVVPVFAVGRSQEVMLTLEDLINTDRVPDVPIYLDGMIWEATAIHTAYPEYLNKRLTNKILHENENPLLSERFIRVDSRDKRKEILASSDPCIVLATSGMINGGPIMEYLKTWAPDDKSTLLFVGFQAAGTLGSKIQRGRKELPFTKGGRSAAVMLEMDTATVDGFSGHSDRQQLISYIAQMKPRPKRIMFMHGEERKCHEIASDVYRKFKIKTDAPMNLETIRFV